MFARHAQRSSYSIFVKFRRSRLALRRGIAGREEALALAEELRAGRFHDRDDIFVIKEPEGTVVDAGTPETTPPTASVAPETTPPTASVAPAPPVDEAEEAPADDGARARGPARTPLSPPPSRPASRPLGAHDINSILSLAARLERMRRAMASASSASARVDRALLAATGALSARGRQAPDGLLRSHQRLRDVREASSAAAASCERVAVMLERRVRIAWAAVAPAGRRPESPGDRPALRALRFPRSPPGV
jgi:hypothetical protein